MQLAEEVTKRRTFAIISHPDAGKTTLTEKFLLFGGAIQTAGAVKSNKITKGATSDFMEIERQRGISVATSVMGFDYKGHKVNILDTPGHKDFAEDTYRTLSAVDSVILVVDCVKGVEEQTEKLMGVCRMRNTPVIIFVNKMDREGKDPFSLLDELEEKLNIKVRPLTWPISQGYDFQGVYNLYNQELNLFEASKTSLADQVFQIDDIYSEQLEKHLRPKYVKLLREEVELVDGVYEQLNEENYRSGQVAPVFFGSAINNFGVQELLDTFVKIAPPPTTHFSEERPVQALENQFSGFVFKIHANLDPNHRNRIAFVRICSGKFERNKFYYHTRQHKKLRFASPTSFMANNKSIIEEAWPGDIIGLYDTGDFKIGDTLTEGENLHYRGVPSFSPEILREVVNEDPFKTKQLAKGISQLTDEGVAQLFTQHQGNRKIIGTVGELQFDVIAFRLKEEYGATCSFRPLNIYKACWLSSDNPQALKDFVNRRTGTIAFDKSNNPVFLAESQWIIRTLQEANPEIRFHFTSELNS